MKAMKWFKGGNFLKKEEHYGFLEDQIEEKVTAVFEFYMHCPNCANDVKILCEKTKGVESVEIDTEKSRATVKGTFDVEKLKNSLWRKAQKRVNVVSVDKEEKSSKTPSKR